MLNPNFSDFQSKLDADDREVLDELTQRIQDVCDARGLSMNTATVMAILRRALPVFSKPERAALASYVINFLSLNPQYSLLQHQMQKENRSYTMVSNIMKTKHDTVKNSISNIR